MNLSLSVVLPVRNAEHRLAAQVDELLDVLPDLTRRFEVLVVDDGSTDDTGHVADDLALRYPQVRHVRHSVALGVSEAIQTGLDHTKGEIVLVGDAQLGLPTDDLVKLWHLRHDNDVIVARKPPHNPPVERALLDRLLAWTPSRRPGSQRSPEVQFIRRSALQELRVDQIPAAAARPNFLGKLKAFALGE